MKIYEVWDSSNFAPEFHLKTDGNKQISPKKSPQNLENSIQQVWNSKFPQIFQGISPVVDMLSIFAYIFASPGHWTHETMPDL